MNDPVRLCLEKVAADAIKAAYDADRARLRDEMTVGDRRTAVLDDGTEIGYAEHIHGGKPQLAIIDEEAFLDWVKAHHPDWLEEKVQERYRTQAVEMAKRGLDEIPAGVGWTQPGRSYVMAKMDREQRALVLERLRNGELRELLDGSVPSLPAGET